MARKLGRTLARLVGLVFALLGGWVVLINLLTRSFSGQVLAVILTAGALGAMGGVLYLLSFDGPARFRTRSARMAGWAGMVALALLPSSLSLGLLALVLLVIPTLFARPGQDSEAASPA